MTAWFFIVIAVVGFSTLTPAKNDDAPKDDKGSNVAGVEHGIVYQKDGIYACFPSLVPLGDGRIAATFDTRARASHMDATGGTKTMVTADGGDSWTEFNGPVIDPSWKASDGTIVVADADGWIEVPADQRERLQREKRFINDVRPGVIAYLGGAHYRVSEDGGKTWEKHAIPIPDDISGLMHYGDDVSHIRTSDGVRLVAIYGFRKGTKTDEVFLLRSDNDGKSWDFFPLVPDGSANPELGFNETALAELPDGNILAVMRSNPGGHLYCSISEDRGLTWSTPRRTGIWGYPADLLVLPDGRVLCAYGYRRPPMGVRACLSNDGGKTWDVEHEMILRADGVGIPEDLGYPRVALLPNGKILTVYYINTNKSGRRVHIAWTRWSVPDAKMSP